MVLEADQLNRKREVSHGSSLSIGRKSRTGKRKLACSALLLTYVLPLHAFSRTRERADEHPKPCKLERHLTGRAVAFVLSPVTRHADGFVRRSVGLGRRGLRRSSGRMM